MSGTVTRNITVKGSPSDVFDIWANFPNFPHFMEDIESVTDLGQGNSHWVMRGLLGHQLEWDAHVTRAEPGRRLAWHSTGGDLKTSGQVTFAELPNDETQVTVTTRYVTDGLAQDVLAMFVDTEGMLARSLRRFKAFAEQSPPDNER